MAIIFEREFFFPIGTSQCPISFDSASIEVAAEVLLKELGVSTLGIVTQTHSDVICNITYSDIEHSPKGSITNLGAADSILLSEIPSGSRSESSFAFGIRTADCLPVIIQSKNQAAIIHAGWRGLAQNLIEKTIMLMLANANQHNQFQVWIGPAGKKCCYEVGEDVLRALNLPTSKTAKSSYLDLQELAESRVRSLINPLLLKVDRRCTICDSLLYSHRQNGTKNRNLSFFAI